jgi:integrase
MGQVFQRSYKAKDGTIRTCETWTIRYFRRGRAQQEHGFTTKGAAQATLKIREGDVARGVPISAAAVRTTFDDAAADVINDFKVNGKRSLDTIERRIRLHLTPCFGGRRLSDISASDVRAFIAARQQEGAANGTINRDLQILKRCFSLAIKAHKIYGRPDMRMLREAAPRAGFFDRAAVDRVCAHLPAVLADVVRFAFITGWRIPSEVLRLEWRHVDFAAGVVRLDANMTKTGEARTFPLSADLRRLLTARDIAREALRATGTIVPWVFWRGTPPAPIRDCTTAFRSACAAAGCPGRIPHDLRRSGVRTLVRAGIPERVCMALTGHKTRSVFERYNIVSESDLVEAARKLDRDSFGTVGASSGWVKGQNR